jgi:hypothetical protein
VANEASVAKAKEITELNRLVDESEQSGASKLVDQSTRLYMS